MTRAPRLESFLRSKSCTGLPVVETSASLDNVEAVAVIHEVVELNIGHFLIGEAVFVGLETAVSRMRHLMNAARADVVTHE